MITFGVMVEFHLAVQEGSANIYPKHLRWLAIVH